MDYFNNKAYFSGESQRSAPSPFGYFPDGKRRLLGTGFKLPRRGLTLQRPQTRTLVLSAGVDGQQIFEHLLAVFGLVSSLHFRIDRARIQNRNISKTQNRRTRACPQIPNPAAAKGKECIRAIGFPSKNGRYRSNVEHYFP